MHKYIVVVDKHKFSIPSLVLFVFFESKFVKRKWGKAFNDGKVFEKICLLVCEMNLSASSFHKISSKCLLTAKIILESSVV